MFTKYALNALAIDFFIIQNTAIMEEFWWYFLTFWFIDNLIDYSSSFFQVIFICQNQRLVIIF